MMKINTKATMDNIFNFIYFFISYIKKIKTLELIITNYIFLFKIIFKNVYLFTKKHTQ